MSVDDDGPGMDGDGVAGDAGCEDLMGVLEADEGDDDGEARCMNLSALTRPLSDVTVADRPGGADMEQ